MRKSCWIVIFLLCVGLSTEVRSVFAQNAKPRPKEKKMERGAPAGDKQDILNVNVIPLETLETLPGMTPELAERVFDGRPYPDAEALLLIEGIDETFLESWEDLVDVKKVNLNDATLLELTMLPEVTPELAKEIIENRPLKMPEELLLFDGMSEETLGLLREWIETKPAKKEDETRGWKNKKRHFSNRAFEKTSDDDEEEPAEPEE